MHLYFITRGGYGAIQEFKTFMRTQMFPWKRKNLKTKKDEMFSVQGMIRPIQLWEYIFPEEELGNVLAMLNLNKNPNSANDTKGKRTSMNILRELLKAKSIPKGYEKVLPNRYVPVDKIALHPIGIKKDRREKVKSFGYEQEML